MIILPLRSTINKPSCIDIISLSENSLAALNSSLALTFTETSSIDAINATPLSFSSFTDEIEI